MRFALGHGIAADDTVESVAQRHLLEQGLCEPCRLVRDDAAADAALGEYIEHLVHARKQAGPLAQVGAIDLEKAILQLRETIGIDVAESLQQHAARAVTDEGPDRGVWQECAALLAEQTVHRIPHVGRRIENGPVKVKQDRAQGRDGQRARVGPQDSRRRKCAR